MMLRIFHKRNRALGSKNRVIVQRKEIIETSRARGFLLALRKKDLPHASGAIACCVGYATNTD